MFLKISDVEFHLQKQDPYPSMFHSSAERYPPPHTPSCILECLVGEGLGFQVISLLSSLHL